jgi:hypothetical protein
MRTHKRDIDDQVLSLEERVGGTSLGRVIGDGSTKRRGVDATCAVLKRGRHSGALSPCRQSTAVSIRRGGIAHREEPDRDALLGKLGHEDASAGLSETGAVALRTRVGDDAALVRVVGERAIGRIDVACEGGVSLIKVAALGRHGEQG